LLVEIVDSPSAREITLGFYNMGSSSSEIVLVPPQDSETNSVLAQLAFGAAANGVTAVLDGFDESRTSGCTDTVLQSVDGATGSTFAERLAYFYREALEVSYTAADRMAFASAAVSDSAYSRLADNADASAFITADFASRSLAAHMLVGGETGLPALEGEDQDGFFTRPRLSGEAQRALQWFRSAAIDPALLRDSSASAPTVDQLAVGGGPVTTEDSLAERLGRMQSRENLRTASTAEAVFGLLGVTREGFSEAREHLREEMRAFDRSPDVLMPAEELPDGTLTSAHGIDLYAATRTPPRVLLESWWAAVLRFDSTPNPVLTGYTTYSAPPGWVMVPDASGNLPPGDTYGDETDATVTDPVVAGERALISVIDDAHRRGADVLDRLCPSGTCDPSFGEAAATVAGAMTDLAPSPDLEAAEAMMASGPARYDTAPYVGRARACWWNTGPSDTTYDIRIEVAAEVETDLLVVRGRDGLECAVRGIAEGTPCDATLFASLLPTTSAWSTASGPIHSVRVTGEGLSGRPRADTISLFVVQRRPGFSGSAAPGQYEQMTGFILPKPASSATGYQYCTGAAIAPRHDREAADLIAPATSPPYRPGQTCAGLPADMRIPLENELTSDARPLESSWLHYLERAHRTAADADALGEDLIRTGLEMDLRSEAAADDINRLCGVTINLTSLRDELDDSSLPPVAAGAPPCTPPYVQQQDECVLDPVLHAASRSTRDDDMARLATCIGADTVPWATLGDRRLCIWDLDPDTPGGICEGSDPRSMRCPFEADEAGNCTGPIPGGATPIAIEERVGLFRQPDDPPPPPPDAFGFPCEELARLRAGLGSLRDVAPVRTFLGLGNFSTHTEQLEWEALVGDYSVVRYGGSIVFRTGSIQTGPTSGWPAGTALPTGTSCPTSTVTDPLQYTGPLFCLREVPLTDRRTRARMNDLLARAVMAVRIGSGQGLEGVVFPYYARNTADVYTPSATDFAWEPVAVPMGNPTAACAWSGDMRIDHFDPGDTAAEYTRNIAELGSGACRIDGSAGTLGTECTGAIPDTAEWTLCPYDSTGVCRVFDDQPDCDDLGYPDEDVPMLFRPSDAGIDIDAARGNAQYFWDPDIWIRVAQAGDRSASELQGTLNGALGIPIANLTRYFKSWSRACNFNEYEDCVEEHGQQRLQQEGNLAFIAQSGLTYADLLNGMELVCAGGSQGLPQPATSCDEPNDIADLGDAFQMSGYLECRANELSAYGANSIVRNLPRRVLDALRSDGHGTYGAGAGELDAQVSEIRAALIELGTIRTSSAADMRAFASRIRALQSAVSSHERAREIELLVSIGRALDRLTKCATAAADAATTDPAAAAGKAAAAGAVCANTVAQTVLDAQVTRLRRANIDDAIVAEFANFTGEAVEFGRRAADRATSMRAALERIDAALARVRATQTQARRALARALLLDDDGMQAHFGANTAYRQRYNTLLERYRRAHLRAVRSAYIARIALEQRLGTPLADIEADVFSDEAPSDWVDTICTLPSIDYDSLRTSTTDEDGEREGDGSLIPPDGYTGAYVGDYVRRLEDVFESYSFVHPFRDGGDTTVISLRDDVFRTRAECEVPSPNLLFNGGRLDVFESSARPGWRIVDCDPGAVAGPPTADRQCVSVEPLSDTSDMPEGEVDLGRDNLPQPYQLRFGGSDATLAASRLEQEVLVGPGRYRLSWYARAGSMIAPADAFVVRDAEDADLLTGTGTFDEAVPGTATWRRYWFFFDVASEQLIRAVAPHGSSPAVAAQIDVAGVMLEEVTDSVVGDVDRPADAMVMGGPTYGEAAAPAPFAESGDLGVMERRVCIDHAGDWFRDEAWVSGCVRVCSDGYDGTCPPEWAELRCYRETSFDISSDTLQRLLVDGDAGFAAGNFNYRIESVAVNLVGTGLRDCETAGGSSGCFASGNISYSLLHQGPFLVRNATGALYDAPLFPGRIESARALAAERYLTNPVSGSDRTLIEPYTRAELQGRPMGGTLVLRIWDDPQFVFEQLEDVQILLSYRYWQHQR